MAICMPWRFGRDRVVTENRWSPAVPKSREGPSKRRAIEQSLSSSPLKSSLPPFSQSLQNLRLGLGDVVQRAEKLEMYRGHIRNHDYIRLTDQRESPDLPGMVHAQFDNSDFIIVLEAQEAEWNSEVVVQVPGRFADLILLPQEGRGKTPCCGLAHAAGHGHQ